MYEYEIIIFWSDLRMNMRLKEWIYIRERSKTIYIILLYYIYFNRKKENNAWTSKLLIKERRNELINTLMNELTIALVNEQMNGQTNERTNECTNEWSNELSDRCSDKRIVWWTGERTVGQMLGRNNSRSEERRVGKEGRSRWSPYH